MEHFKTLSAYLEYLELPKSEHPMISVLFADGQDFLPCPKPSSPPITNACYSISLKKLIHGELNYGRTKFDFSNGALICMGPRQVMQWDQPVEFEQKGFSINFHEDFVKGTPLAKQIKDCGFFNYSVHEALHLSPKEEDLLMSIVANIHDEYNNNTDAFSRDIILTQLSTLLKYASRFYERQFEHRKDLATHMVQQFRGFLDGYLAAGKLQEQGIPAIAEIAGELTVSQRYLSDALKKETGLTSTEHLQLYLIDQAKHALLDPDKTISEVAYALGFEYPPYFSRLFKKTAGVSPSEYRNQHKNN